MANIWCCEAAVKTEEPMDVPGYPQSTDFTVYVKVRTGDREPSDASIISAARNLMDSCYSAKVLDVHNPRTCFLLWEGV